MLQPCLDSEIVHAELLHGLWPGAMHSGISLMSSEMNCVCVWKERERLRISCLCLPGVIAFTTLKGKRIFRSTPLLKCFYPRKGLDETGYEKLSQQSPSLYLFLELQISQKAL